MTIDDLLKQIDIGEDQDVEFKSADGGLPKSVWETISAFSNTEGGFIILGVTHKGDKLEITGIRKPEAMVKAFWDAHNSPEKLKPPVCKASDVLILAVSGHRIIVINVPRALRQQRPVFINGNPLTGTFKRNFEGDYRCTEAEVRQMLRDASDEPQDSQIIENFDLSDLDAQSLSAYRNRFASRDPGHPFLAFLFSPRSEHLEASSEHLLERSEHLAVTSEHYQALLKIEGVVREKGKAGKDIVKQVILQLCADDYLSLRTLSDLLNRAPDSIRTTI
jgi:hypothetical protein